MTTSKNDFVSYTPLPQTPTTVVLIPYYRPPPPLLRLRRLFSGAVIILLLAAATFFLYPSDPTLRLTRLSLNHVAVRASPEPTLDLSFSLTVRVLNRDFFSLNYHSLVASVYYRGRELGVVSSAGGEIRARGSSNVDATLDLDGLRIVYDAFYLIEDLARGSIPFQTDSTVEGDLGLFFFKIPLKATVTCEIQVNTANQTITHQDCYPK